jgi:2'-5' RNA ligase
MDLRAFIAIEIPASLQDVIARQTSNLRRQYPNPAIRWVPPRNIHLTLKFLGDVSTKELDLLSRFLCDEVNTLKPFSINAGEMGLFPTVKRPRIIWVGIKAPSILFSLQSKIEAITSRLGHKLENRQFNPHVTIGRFGPSFHIMNIPKILHLMESIDYSIFVPVDIDSFKIFKSDLNPSGPVYTAIHTIPFEK